MLVRTQPPKRYVLCPGTVVSRTDGQRHYIGPLQLARLYGIDFELCMVYEPAPWWTPHDYALEQVRCLGLIRLCPQTSGDYSLPTTP